MAWLGIDDVRRPVRRQPETDPRQPVRQIPESGQPARGDVTRSRAISLFHGRAAYTFLIASCPRRQKTTGSIEKTKAYVFPSISSFHSLLALIFPCPPLLYIQPCSFRRDDSGPSTVRPGRRTPSSATRSSGRGRSSSPATRPRWRTGAPRASTTSRRASAWTIDRSIDRRRWRKDVGALGCGIPARGRAS